MPLISSAGLVATDGLESLPEWVQLLTRWPLTHASQAYFSPLINIVFCFAWTVPTLYLLVVHFWLAEATMPGVNGVKSV